MTSQQETQAQLEFKCRQCSQSVYFSVLEADHLSKSLECAHCKKKYMLGSQIIEQLKKFEALCCQIQESKSIFGQSSIAIDVGPHQVKIPFQLLLTRLSSVLELSIGGEKVTISFRVDTLNGLSLSNKKIST